MPKYLANIDIRSQDIGPEKISIQMEGASSSIREVVHDEEVNFWGRSGEDITWCWIGLVMK
jgi:hypothetical protein